MKHRPRWRRVPTEVKTDVHGALVGEQRGICCYCEGRVAVDDSHVEHFRPRERFEALQLDYANLLASCGRDQAAGMPRHCGHRKGSWFVEGRLVSPLSPNCEDRFRFTANGHVLPVEGDDAAVTTIARLGLDLPKLNALRAAAVEALYDLPPSEVRRLLAAEVDGNFVPYYSTIKQVLAA